MHSHVFHLRLSGSPYSSYNASFSLDIEHGLITFFMVTLDNTGEPWIHSFLYVWFNLICLHVQKQKQMKNTTKKIDSPALFGRNDQESYKCDTYHLKIFSWFFFFLFHKYCFAFLLFNFRMKIYFGSLFCSCSFFFSFEKN